MSMKTLTSLSAVAVAFTSSTASAARLTVETEGASPYLVYALFVAGESTVFNGLGVSVTPDGDAIFQQVTVGTPRIRPPLDPFTYRNRLLDADPSEFPDSKGWTLLGVQNISSHMAFSGGPLGRTIDTGGEPDGKLFLVNVVLLPGVTATATLQLVNGIDTVFTQTLRFPIPEPGAGSLLATLAVALSFRRRPRT